MSALKDLGSFIREQRSTAQISLRQLAAAAGVSNPYLSQIERGLRKPSAEILQQIAKGLRISAEALYVQAGMLDERVGDPDVAAAIVRDSRLSERQKHVLLEIYESFVRESTEAQRVAAQTRFDEEVVAAHPGRPDPAGAPPAEPPATDGFPRVSPGTGRTTPAAAKAARRAKAANADKATKAGPTKSDKAGPTKAAKRAAKKAAAGPSPRRPRRSPAPSAATAHGPSPAPTDLKTTDGTAGPAGGAAPSSPHSTAENEETA